MTIKIWQTTSGRSPVLKFIDKQPDAAVARITKEIEHLQRQGLNLLVSPSKLKQLQGYKALFELKIDFKGVFYRILFTVVDDEAWLLEAFKKKANETKTMYIGNAVRRQASLLARAT